MIKPAPVSVLTEPSGGTLERRHNVEYSHDVITYSEVVGLVFRLSKDTGSAQFPFELVNIEVGKATAFGSSTRRTWCCDSQPCTDHVVVRDAKITDSDRFNDDWLSLLCPEIPSPGLKVGLHGTVWHTGTSWVGSKPYRNLFHSTVIMVHFLVHYTYRHKRTIFSTEFYYNQLVINFRWTYFGHQRSGVVYNAGGVYGCDTMTFESLDVGSSFSHIRYISRG